MAMSVRQFCAAALVMLLGSPCLTEVAHAWGDEGHMAVALVAQEFLTPAARQHLESLLASDNDPLTLTDIASRTTWADRYRDSDRSTTKVRYNATRNWHFIDIELDAPDQDHACFGHPPVPAGKPASEGPAEDCAVDKIDQFWSELKDPATSEAERHLALKFLLPFVGDLHQPLHSADNHDGGGNGILVVYGRRRIGTPLHAYWDNDSVSNINNDAQELAAALIDRFRDRQSEWMSGRPKDWAAEAFEKARSIVYNLPSQQVRDSNNKPVYQLDRGYEEDARETAAEQLAKAGIRLALVLNDALQ
jgi:nuclease S1